MTIDLPEFTRKIRFEHVFANLSTAVRMTNNVEKIILFECANVRKFKLLPDLRFEMID
jgi:hypothetical protein